MSQVSNQQWRKLHERAALPEDSAGFISGETIQALLEGRLATKATLIDYVALKTQFDLVPDDCERVTEVRTIAVRKNVPDTESVEDLELIEINRDKFSTEEARAETARWRRLPATLQEGLLYARKFPNAQREGPIVMFGTELICDGYRCISYLSESGRKRSLYLAHAVHLWMRNSRCLVRKVA